MARVLAISDLHAPWMHRRALDHLQRIRDQYKLDRIVCLGDEIDAASFSMKWSPNPDLPGPNDELKWAIEKLQPFYKAFPECTVVESNHGMRIFKKARVTGLPSKVIKRYQDILEYPPGWEFVPEIEIDGVLYIHGEGFSRSSWRLAHEKHKQSVCMGHIHSAGGVFYSQTRKRRNFSANMGCLIDPRLQAFDYGKHLAEKPTIGSGAILSSEEAYFVPLSS